MIIHLRLLRESPDKQADEFRPACTKEDLCQKIGILTSPQKLRRGGSMVRLTCRVAALTLAT